jgi:hypothetical protein
MSSGMACFIAHTRYVITWHDVSAASMRSTGVGPRSVPPKLVGSSAMTR